MTQIHKNPCKECGGQIMRGPKERTKRFLSRTYCGRKCSDKAIGNDEERFLDHCIPEPNSGCWLWLSATKSKYGYGVFMVRGKLFQAHRWAYKNFIGEIPKNLIVRHKCDNTYCVNPDHLLTGTQKDNMQDAVKRKRLGKKQNRN